MKALVTGASGFIGSTLIEELGQHLPERFEVFALMRRTSSTANLEGLSYTRVEGSLDDLESLKRAVQGMDYVFHLAGVVRARDRAEFFRHNAEGTELLARAVAEANPTLKRFVLVSSLAAGGPAASLEPRTEDQVDQPVSHYGESKLAGEKALLQFKDVFPVSIVRPPIVYGPRDKDIFIFVKNVARSLKVIPVGATVGGHKYYSAIHARDLARGIIRAGLAPVSKVSSGEVFYLSADGIVSYEEILDAIACSLSRKCIRVKVPAFVIKAAAAGLTVAGKITNKTFPLNLDKLNEILPDYWICSNHKAKELLGFVPEMDLQAGMTNAVEWYKRQKWI